MTSRDRLAATLAVHQVVMSYDSQDRAVAVCSCGYQEAGGTPDAHRADALLASGTMRNYGRVLPWLDRGWMFWVGFGLGWGAAVIAYGVSR